MNKQCHCKIYIRHLFSNYVLYTKFYIDSAVNSPRNKDLLKRDLYNVIDNICIYIKPNVQEDLLNNFKKSFIKYTDYLVEYIDKSVLEFDIDDVGFVVENIEIAENVNIDDLNISEDPSKDFSKDIFKLDHNKLDLYFVKGIIEENTEIVKDLVTLSKLSSHIKEVVLLERGCESILKLADEFGSAFSFGIFCNRCQ
jgi:hypothetical protein